MALDPRYVPLTTIWQLFTDKDTGNFLRNGYVKFWVDTNRTVGKPVYELTGSPPNYTYIEYGFMDTDGGWRVDINDQGALDSIPYAFPYDNDGNIELYFIQVFSADNVPQFTREGLPNVTGTTPGGNTEVAVNFVPNPQFLLHLDLPKTTTYQEGQVRSAITDMAWGGWTFERPTGSTATDFIIFDRFGSDVTDPEKSPRFALRVKCESPSAGDTFKDIRLKFRDVNKFSSNTDYFTFAFYSQVNSGSALTASIILIKNYGTGGSSPTETVLGSVTIGSSWALQPTSFIFGENTGKTIGILDDDYLQLVIRLPVDSIFDVSFDSVDLAKGQVSNPSMPYTTDSMMIYRSLAGFMPIPNPDGSDLYLPVRLTNTGMEFDHTQVGKIYVSTSALPEFGELSCNGTQLDYSGYSIEGVPYKRLGDKLWDDTNKFYKFGSGTNFVTISQIGSTAEIKLTTNILGAVGATTDGTPSTGFTFNTIKNGSPTYGFNGYKNANGVLIQINTVGTFTASSSGTSGFSIVDIRNSSGAKGLISITNITVASGLASKYFEISNTTTNYYIWFKVDGAGTDPAISGKTGIEIDLRSTYDSTAVSQTIADAISGKQISDILCTSSSSITSGSAFFFDTVGNNYYVWYKKGGIGTDPNISGRTGIEVDIGSSDTAIQVAVATLIAVNKKYYATPDLRGMFIRAANFGSGVDPDVNSRFNLFSNSFGDEIGTIQIDDIVSHNHTFQTIDQIGVSPQGNHVSAGDMPVSPVFHTINTTFSGGFESRPVNMYLNFVIKY